MQDLKVEKKWFDNWKGTDDSSNPQVQSSREVKMTKDGIATTTVFAHDKLSFKAKGNAHKDGGWKVDLTGSGERKEAKGEWKVAGQMDVKGDLGAAKMGMNVSTRTRRMSLMLYLSNSSLPNGTKRARPPSSPSSTLRSATRSTSVSPLSGTRPSRKSGPSSSICPLTRRATATGLVLI